MQSANVITELFIYKVDGAMIDKNKIKVVKRGDAAPKNSRKRKAASPRSGARQIVSNVTGWVADLKTRKSEETKAAFDLLFAANRQPSES